MAWPDSPLIGLDFETTGVDPLSDLPVQVALVWCDGGGELRTASWLVDPGREVPEGAVAVHGITTERVREEGLTLAETARRVHRELEKAALEDVPVVAMNASFDVTIASRLFFAERLSPLSWQLVVDPLVLDRHLDRYRKGKRRLDALCAHYGVRLESAHDAGHDAAAAVALARELGRRFPDAGELEVGELTRLQCGWHREWASGFDDWCRRQGRSGLAEEEFDWPVRGAGRPVDQPTSESSTTSTSASLERGLTTAMRIATLS